MITTDALRLFALTTALTGSTVPSSSDVVWAADPAQSNVTLSASELFIARITGTIPITAATIVTTDESVVPLSVNAVLDPGQLDTHDPRRDADLRSARFFDAARYPTITFVSEHIVTTGPQSFTIDGELSMRGITRPMRFDGRVAGVSSDAHGERHMRYEAHGRFRRSDYGMSYARGIVGNDVTLNVDIEASTKETVPSTSSG